MRLVIDLQGAQGSSHARGIGRYSRELARAMASEARGHEVIIALSGAFPETAELLISTFARVLPRSHIRLWYPPLGIAALQDTKLRDFAEALRAQFFASLRPDLVHVSSLFEGLGDDTVTVQPPRLERLPVVFTCYDLIPLIRHQEYFGGEEPVWSNARWYYRCVHEMTLSDGLLAISESSRGEAIRHLPYSPERVFNVQAGISADFRPANLPPDARSRLLRRYGLQDSFILFLGTGDIRKNEAGLIAAYAQLPKALQLSYQLVIVGKMDEAALRATATTLSVSVDRFIIIPFVEEVDLNGLYSSCALFVLPSLHEGFGLPLAEAMACGAPAICSNTTSLPEVIGRADATFDPADPSSIAACMRKVLENPDLREDLAASGPARAGRFTWQSTAARAWDALEQIHALRLSREKLRPVSVLSPRLRLAIISPFPPARSEVADYSRELVPYLARYYDITLVTETKIEDIRLEAAFPILDSTSFPRQACQFDRVLYLIGNTQLHRFQIEDLLPNNPGIVVLYDVFLSDYMNSLAQHRGRPDDFRSALLASHGYPALRYDAINGREAAVAKYPCSLVLKASIAVIQHSCHEVEILERHFRTEATKGISVIPFLRANHPRPSRTEARRSLGLGDGDFVVCSFGNVTEENRPRLLAEAWGRAHLAGRMVFAGDAEPELREVLADNAGGVHFTGELSREQYDGWLAACDLVVQWRTGPRKDPSETVADVLMAGLPLIINWQGLPEEFPDNVALCLPDLANVDALAAAIVALHGDVARRDELSAAAREYARLEMAPVKAAQHYYNAIERAYATAVPAAIARSLAPEAQAAAELPGGLLAASHAIGRSFPQPWHPGSNGRLLIDMSQLARLDHGSGIQRVVREIGRRVLEAAPGGRRGDAVRVHEGRLRYTYEAPLRILGHAPLGVSELPADVCIGDVLLCADMNAEMSQAEFAELRRIRLSGMRIIPVIYDLLPMRYPQLFPEAIRTLVPVWYQRMLAIADGVACISRSVANDVVEWLDQHRETRATPLPIGYFHLGSDFSDETDVKASPAVRTALDNSGRRPTVVMTGTIEPRKGYPQAVAAFEDLWRAGLNIGLTIVGKQGWHMEAFVSGLQSSPDLGNRLHWLPNCTDSELLLLYRAGAGLLMASSHEGFGLPIVEAARAGLPVMARDLPVFREVAGDHARYFSGDSPEALAAALRCWLMQEFTPSPIGIRPLTWDDSFRQLCAVVFEERWHTIWQP
jgi:glycosyltransferase involved in cell wall biosynthesis